MSPDPILKPTELNVNYSNIENNLIIKFNGVSDRVIRVAANNVMENLKTVVECFEEFWKLLVIPLSSLFSFLFFFSAFP